MLAKEFERAGFPTALVTAIPAVAESLGVYRIVTGKGVSYPFGDPQMAPEAERAFRRSIIERALRAMKTSVDSPTVFDD